MRQQSPESGRPSHCRSTRLSKLSLLPLPSPSRHVARCLTWARQIALSPRPLPHRRPPRVRFRWSRGPVDGDGSSRMQGPPLPDKAPPQRLLADRGTADDTGRHQVAVDLQNTPGPAPGHSQFCRPSCRTVSDRPQPASTSWAFPPGTLDARCQTPTVVFRSGRCHLGSAPAPAGRAEGAPVACFAA